MSDRYTPYTSEARMRGYVVPVASQVAGEVTNVEVIESQIVEEGDVLLQLDTTQYQLAVNKAQAELENVGQSLGAGMAAVVAAETGLANAKTELSFVKRQSKRALALETDGVISEIEADKVRTALEKAILSVANAEAKLLEEQQTQGIEGDENPRMRSALAALRQAQLDLSRTRVLAPSQGVVSNLTIDVGHYASVGQPLMTFISTNAVWVDAYMRENCLENIQPGDEVDMVLDVAPGRIFKGKVVSTAYGISWGQEAAAGNLPSIKTTRGWMRSSQHFPVKIVFTDETSKGFRRVGGQANVVVYTEDGFIMNGIGMLWIRLISLLSYLH